jgi:hypothetical protein
LADLCRRTTGAANPNPDPPNVRVTEAKLQHNDFSQAPPTATTTLTILGKETVVPYVPDDLTFEIAADGGVTLHFGAWIRQQLEQAAQKVVPCSLRRLKTRQSQTMCGYRSFLQNVAQNEPLVIRVTACAPEPLEQAIEVVISSNPELVAGFSSLGITGIPGAVSIVGGNAGVATLFGALYLTWPSISSSLGSGSSNSVIPAALSVLPQAGSSGQTNEGSQKACPTLPQEFVRFEMSLTVHC